MMRFRMTIRLLLALAVGSIAFAAAVQDRRYDEMRAAAVRSCEAIDPAQYQTGLWLNPDGYRSYYVRSQCIQDAAVRFRDTGLCGKVRRRWSLSSSSWGYSAANCRTLVKAAVAQDRRELEQLKREYAAAHMVLRDVRVERNGNGRDFDFFPQIDGAPGHGYLLVLDVDAGAGAPIPIHSSGYFVDPKSPLRIYVLRADLQRVPGFTFGRPCAVRATMTFSLPTGTMDAVWPDAFVESIFPARERSQSVTRAVTFF
jgi:hypothetical protein